MTAFFFFGFERGLCVLVSCLCSCWSAQNFRVMSKVALSRSLTGGASEAVDIAMGQDMCVGISLHSIFIHVHAQCLIISSARSPTEYTHQHTRDPCYYTQFAQHCHRAQC